MVLAVCLQILGALLGVAAVGLLAGPKWALGAAAIVVFAAGYSHERAHGTGG